MMPPHMREQSSSLAKLLALALMIAVICNGASFYLKRTGLVDHDAYRAFWAVHCAVMKDATVPERQCSRYSTPAEIKRYGPAPSKEVEDASFRYVYEASPAERPLKFAKDLFWLALIAISLSLFARQKAGWEGLRQAWPLLLLCGYSMAAFVGSVPVNGTWVAVAGLRSFLFVLLALLGRWLVPQLSIFATCAAALLILQALLVPFELIQGIHLFGDWTDFSLASRVVGTLSQPNSLGVFAAAAMAFWYSFSSSPSWLWPLSLVALCLVLLSGSGTGLVCVALALLFILRERLAVKWRWGPTAIGVMGAVIVLLMLPNLTGRSNLFDSVRSDGSRWSVLRSSLLDRAPIEVALGSGLGVNTNTALNLAALDAPPTREGASPTAALPTDSTLTGLVIQIGLVGTLLFYGTLLWAGVRDPLARPFYCIVALCTLTINVTELFPVNVLLGLSLAHSAWNPGRRQ